MFLDFIFIFVVNFWTEASILSGHTATQPPNLALKMTGAQAENSSHTKSLWVSSSPSVFLQPWSLLTGHGNMVNGSNVKSHDVWFKLKFPAGCRYHPLCLSKHSLHSVCPSCTYSSTESLVLLKIRLISSETRKVVTSFPLLWGEDQSKLYGTKGAKVSLVLWTSRFLQSREKPLGYYLRFYFFNFSKLKKVIMSYNI